jgi:hypothetical protein
MIPSDGPPPTRKAFTVLKAAVTTSWLQFNSGNPLL